MTNLYLAIAGVFAVLIILALMWLVGERSKFKKELQLLNELINRSNRDVAGLCSAAISVDQRLTEQAGLLKGLQAKVADFKQVEVPAAAQPYAGIIQKVQAGATASELVQNFGLSGEEAALLIRLHGKKASDS